MTAIPLSRIRADKRLQPRVMTDLAVSERYAQAMLRGDTLPPVVVFFDGTDYWLADGFHRFQAHEILELPTLDCTVIEGSLSDAVWHTCSANATNGQPRTQDDLRLAIERALKHPNAAEKTDRQIAAHVGCSDKTVAPIRARLEAVAEIPQLKTRIGKDGKRYKARKGKVAAPNQQRYKRVNGEWVPTDDPMGRLAETIWTHEDIADIAAAAREAEQLDIEDAIDAATAAGGPKLVKIDQTWMHLMHATDDVRRAHRILPDPQTTAANFPLDVAYDLEMADVRRIAAWWADFVALWEARQPAIRTHLARARSAAKRKNNVA
jgi:ParB-like chromosome segregation protein Spo0J